MGACVSHGSRVAHFSWSAGECQGMRDACFHPEDKRDACFYLEDMRDACFYLEGKRDACFYPEDMRDGWLHIWSHLKMLVAVSRARATCSGEMTPAKVASAPRSVAMSSARPTTGIGSGQASIGLKR